jgi:hypothetical protein
MRARVASLILAAGLALGGCAYGGFGNGLGVGVSYGDPYGYGGYGGYNDPYYGYGYGSGYGYGYGSPYYGGYYGSPYWGWNNGFYYPGTGYYVYDRDRRRRVLTDAERAYWKEKLARFRTGATSTASAKTVVPRENWSGFSRRSSARTVERQVTRDARVQARQQQRTERVQQRSQTRSDRSQARSERVQSRIDRIQSRRSSKTDEQ